MIKVEVYGKVHTFSGYEELGVFLFDNNLEVDEDGNIFEKENVGCVPSILDEWFKKRKEYQALAHKHGESGDEDQHTFYDRRQHIQKILLNSMYGVLGLPVFRFYDVDNAEAVTITGQSVIKFTERIINKFYNDNLGTGEDYVIYVDTDSTFVSAVPLVKKFYPDVSVDDVPRMTEVILDVSQQVQDYVNGSYNALCAKVFNLKTHRFDIKREYIARSGLWVTKKRYAQWIIYNKGLTVDKLDIKGIDVVRSSYPAAFQEFLKKTLKDILMGKTKEEIDDSIMTFRQSMASLPLADVAKSSSVKQIMKYDLQNTTEFKERSRKYNRKLEVGARKIGTPAHVKAAISFNELLHVFEVSTHYPPFRDGDKIKWVYLKDNQYGLEGVAFRGYDDPPEIVEFIRTYIDYSKIFKRELHSKLDDLYSALGWIMLTDNFAVASKFFDFNGG